MKNEQRTKKLFILAGMEADFVAQSTEMIEKKYEGEVVAKLPLAHGKDYTRDYTRKLRAKFFSAITSGYKRYKSSVSNLRKGREAEEFTEYLKDKRIILLYVKKNGINTLFETFISEVLFIPLESAKGASIVSAVTTARRMIGEVFYEINDNESRTCALLPPNNFGKDFKLIFFCVHKMTERPVAGTTLGKELQKLNLRRVRKGRSKFYVGNSGTIFESVRKAGARHGYAPALPLKTRKCGHKPQCAIRGRMRFGVPFDPSFHYDCNYKKSQKFIPCHGESMEILGQPTHVNIAPNDNIRY